MKYVLFASIASTCLALITLSSNDARAACADPAAPDVDWVRCYFDERDLRGVSLIGAHLRDTRFTRADLSSADLSKADAFRTKFVSARLVKTKLDGARLTGSDFTKADLTGASLVKADLRRAKLFRSILRDANLTGARLSGADLINADLSGALWTDGKTRCAEGSIGQCNTTQRSGTDGSS